MVRGRGDLPLLQCLMRGRDGTMRGGQPVRVGEGSRTLSPPLHGPVNPLSSLSSLSSLSPSHPTVTRKRGLVTPKSPSVTSQSPR